LEIKRDFEKYKNLYTILWISCGKPIEIQAIYVYELLNKENDV
jgi:hypothetical protein